MGLESLAGPALNQSAQMGSERWFYHRLWSNLIKQTSADKRPAARRRWWCRC